MNDVIETIINLVITIPTENQVFLISMLALMVVMTALLVLLKMKQ